ncbi:MAG: OmcA/MtrC family decaheme c-type cytochrome [Nitrospirota bacterium]
MVKSVRNRFAVVLPVVFALLTLLAGCGNDGSPGATGPAGAPGTDLTAGAKAETCTLCHADAFAPPAAVHPNLAANVTSVITASITGISVVSSGGTTTFTFDFTLLKDGAYDARFGDRAAPSATGALSSNLAYLRFGYAKLVTDYAGAMRWVSYNQGERAFSRLTDNGGGSYTYVCSALTATTGVTVYDPSATTRVGLQISVIPGETYRPLQITRDVVPDASPLQTRAIVSTAACAECHGTQNGIAHGTRYNADWCVVCHTRETTRGGETVEFKSMIHQIHTSQTRSFFNAAEVTYPQEITHCAKCHKGAVNADNWRNVPSIEACNSCHYVFFGDPAAVPAGQTAHSGGQATNTDCTGCHFAGATTKKDPAVAHMTINATPNNPSVPAGDVNFAYEIQSVVTNTTSNIATTPIITFRILADENATPATPVTFATYTTGATMLTVGTHTFSGGPSFLVAYALPQEGLSGNAATMNDFNNLGKAAGQPATVSLDSLWKGTAGTLTGPAAGGWYTATITSTASKFPAGARLRTIALQGYFTQVDTSTARHALSVTGTVSGDVVRRSVVDPAKCANCHEWFEGHGGNRVIGSGSTGIVVCVLCHNPNLTSSGRTADPATVLSLMSAASQAAMTAAGYNPADPSTYPESTQNFKDMIHATHASAVRTEPYQFVRNFIGRSVTFYDMSEVTFPGRIGDCETCHFTGTYNLPTTAGLLSSTYETTDGNAATSVTTDRTTVPNSNDIVTPPSTAACITCHDSNTPVTHMKAQGGSFKVKRTDAVR